MVQIKYFWNFCCVLQFQIIAITSRLPAVLTAATPVPSCSFRPLGRGAFSRQQQWQGGRVTRTGPTTLSHPACCGLPSSSELSPRRCWWEVISWGAASSQRSHHQGIDTSDRQNLTRPANRSLIRGKEMRKGREVGLLSWKMLNKIQSF